MTTSAAPRSITIEHVVIASNQPYEKVREGLASRLGSAETWRESDERLHALTAAHASWDEVTEAIERSFRTSDITLLYTFDEYTPLLTLVGEISRAIQYTVGNPLPAIQMSRLQPEVALYAPLHFVVYEDEAGKTFVAYDRFASLLAQYQREEITRVALIVEQKLEALLTAVTQ
jgi:uncharacterized protein (DUF302 family)